MAMPRWLLQTLPILLVACALGAAILLSGTTPPGPGAGSEDPRSTAPASEGTAVDPKASPAACGEPWKGRDLSGRVLDARDDSPVAGAVVAAERYREGHIERGPEVRTDAAGGFMIRLAELDPEVAVTASGYTPVCLDVPDHVATLDVRLERLGGFQGRVTAATDGRPVQGAVVRVKALENIHNVPDHGFREVKTDAAGRYRVDGLPAGRASICVLGGGWVSTDLVDRASCEAGPVELPLPPGTIVAADFTVVPAASLTGRVVDHEGRPVVAEVTVRDVVRALQVTTGSDGRFRFDDRIPGAATRLSARVEGWPVGSTGALFPGPGEIRDIEIRMPRPRWVRVRVVEEGSGRGIRDALVRAGAKEAGATDAEGHAHLGPFDDRVVLLRASSLDHVVDLEDRVRVDTARQSEVRIALRPGLEITGRALLPDGTLLTNGDIHCPSVSIRQAELSGHGFRVRGLPPGRHEIDLILEQEGGHWTGRAEAEAGATDVIVRMEWEPEEEGPDLERTVLVHVVDGAGRPVPRATVRARRADSFSTWSHVKQGTAAVEIPIDTESFDLLVHGARSATGWPLPLGAVRVESVAGDLEETTVRLPPELSIAGRVRDAAGGGLAGVRIEATLADEVWNWSRWGRTASDGGFRLGGLRSGTYLLRVFPPDGWIAPDDWVRADAGAVDVGIVLERGLSARFTVLSPSGDPVAGAPVRVYVRQPGGRWDRQGESGTTDAQGVARIVGLEVDGPYSVRATPPRGRLDVLPTRCKNLAAGGTVTLLEGLVVTATVDGEGERGIEGLVVHGRSLEENDWVEGVLIGPRTYRVGPFPAGPVGLVVFDRRDASSPSSWGGRETVVAAGSEGVRLVYRSSRSLVIRVKEWPDGENCEGELLIESPDRPVGHTRSSTDGVFRFTRLAPGQKATFYCRLADDRIAYRVGIPATADEVVVALSPGRTVRGRLILPRPKPVPHLIASGRGWESDAEVEADGQFEVRGLPPGPVHLSAAGCVFTDEGHQHYFGVVDTTAGETVEIRVAIR